MHLLELILALILAPFWVPVLLVFVGFLIILFGVCLTFLLVLLFLIFCLVIGILKTLYNVHIGLVSTRQVILKEFGSDASWWKLGRLIFKRFLKQIKETKELYRKQTEGNETDD